MAKDNRKLMWAGLVVFGFVCFIALVLLGLLKGANATDVSQPIEPVVEESIESPYYRPGIYPQLRHFELEEQYLKLKVDWDDKRNITTNADVGCYDFTGDKKVKCYIGNSYFDKKQISEKALDDFVEFTRKYKVE